MVVGDPARWAWRDWGDVLGLECWLMGVVGVSSMMVGAVEETGLFWAGLCGPGLIVVEMSMIENFLPDRVWGGESSD